MPSVTASELSAPGPIDLLRPVELTREPDLTFGPLSVEPGARALRHEDGRQSEVEPRSMKVLVALLRQPGRVFSRDDLFAACWEGRAVSDDAVDRAVARLRRSLTPVADGILSIQTVTKTGHRALLAEAPSNIHEDDVPGDIGSDGRGAGIQVARYLVVAGAILILFAGIAWLTQSSSPQNNRVAMIPFVAEGGSDTALAIGFGDRIRADLVGRSDLELASLDNRQFNSLSDIEAARLGRRLGFRHVIQGRLMRQGDRMRVETWVVDAQDLRRSWSDEIVAPIAEIIRVQERVAARLASGLGRRLLPQSGSARSVSDGNAQALYLTARGLMRSRDPDRMGAARDLLIEAISRDPNFAAAHASLATAIALGVPNSASSEEFAARSEALPHVRRALSLDPELAEAHAVLGMILGYGSDEAAEHLRRAEELDPNDAEIQFWRGHVYARDFDFANQLAAYRRAIELDPLWWTPRVQLISAATSLSRHQEASDQARQFANVSDRGGAMVAYADLASARNDISTVFGIFEQARSLPGGPPAGLSELYALVFYEIGLIDYARRILPRSPEVWVARSGPVPTIGEVLRLHGEFTAIGPPSPTLLVKTARIVGAGQAAPLAGLYDQPQGLLGLSRRRRPSPEALVYYGPLVSLILAQARRSDEAARLRAAARDTIAAARRRGPVPREVEVQDAMLLSLSGDSQGANRSLRRAVESGWIYRGETALSDIRDEPAFATLRSNTDFLRLREEMLAHLARERAEILSLPLGP